MRIFFLVLALLAVMAQSPAEAAAKQKKTAPAAAQDIKSRPVFDPSGRFSFCLVDHAYKDKRKFTIAQSLTNQLNLGFTIPKAGFELGAKYDLKLTLGDEKPRKIRAQAIDAEAILLQMGASASFRKRLMAAKTLQVGTDNKTIDFALPDMNKTLLALERCLEANKGKTDEKRARAEEALPETLKALLVTAGFTDIAPMDMGAIPMEKRPADYIWKTGNVLGGIRERKAPEGASLTDLVNLHMAGLKNRCAGTFKMDIDREKKVSGLALKTASATCAMTREGQESSVFVAILFYLTERGNFTSFSHESQGQGEAEALLARDKLAKTILAIAAKEP